MYHLKLTNGPENDLTESIVIDNAVQKLMSVPSIEEEWGAFYRF